MKNGVKSCVMGITAHAQYDVMCA